jgi:hypothetical protein
VSGRSDDSLAYQFPVLWYTEKKKILLPSSNSGNIRDRHGIIRSSHSRNGDRDLFSCGRVWFSLRLFTLDLR